MTGVRNSYFFNPQTQKLISSRDLKFDEGQSWNWSEKQGTSELRTRYEGLHTNEETEDNVVHDEAASTRP